MGLERHQRLVLRQRSGDQQPSVARLRSAVAPPLAQLEIPRCSAAAQQRPLVDSPGAYIKIRGSGGGGLNSLFFPICKICMIKLFMSRGQIRLLNGKTTDLEEGESASREGSTSRGWVCIHGESTTGYSQ